MKACALWLIFCAAAAAQNPNRVIDTDAATPESLRPIDEEIHRLESTQRSAIEAHRRAIADWQLRLSKVPDDTAAGAAVSRAQAALATILFDTETQIAAQYDKAAVSGREMAAGMIPCPEHPPIAQQRDHTRRQMEDLLRRSEADRKLAEGGDVSAAARLPLILQEMEEAQVLLTKLAAAAEEEDSQCRSLTEEQSALRNYADRMELRGDIHLLKAAQMAINSLINVIRLRGFADRESLQRVTRAIEKFDQDHFDIAREWERIVREVK